MRIGIDACAAYRAAKTGVEWYAYHIISGLLARAGSVDYTLYTRTPADPLFPNITVKALRWPFSLFWTQLPLAWEMLQHAPDVLFCPADALPAVHPKKTVATIHDVGFLSHREEIRARRFAYLSWSTRFTVQHATRIIAISEFTKRELVRCFRADEHKVSVVHLGYDNVRYTANRNEEEIEKVRAAKGLQNPFILCIGRIDKRKNTLALVHAFEICKKEYPDFDLVLAGPLGFGGEEIMKKIIASPVHKAVHHLGWVSEEEKIALLQGAVCLAFPTLYEGFGLPLVEAQACGTPVVCSQTSALPEIAGVGGALFFDPFSLESIAEQIKKIAAGTARELLISKGFQNVKRFSWEQTIEKTRTLLSF